MYGADYFDRIYKFIRAYKICSPLACAVFFFAADSKPPVWESRLHALPSRKKQVEALLSMQAREKNERLTLRLCKLSSVINRGKIDSSRYNYNITFPAIFADLVSFGSSESAP